MKSSARRSSSTTSSISRTGKIPSMAKASATYTQLIRQSAAISPSRACIWHYDKIRRSISTGAYKDGILYYADFSGFLHALDAKTGKPYWTHDMLAAVWASPVVIGDKVYLGR